MCIKAILVVSFGTSYMDTMSKTIGQIEEDMKKAYPDYRIYRAFTSNRIISILKNRNQLSVMSVKEGMLQMFRENITEVIVQPTHILNGIENEIMTAEIHKYSNLFHTVKLGAPLLTSTEDFRRVVTGLYKEHGRLQKEEALIYMGHGTTHYSNTGYAALEYMFRDYGYKGIYVGTVEAYPALENVLNKLKKKDYKQIKLVPFMIVSGDHARNDMAGKEADSWKSILEKEGFYVNCSLKGLGEYQCIRRLFIEHAVKAIPITEFCDKGISQ